MKKPLSFVLALALTLALGCPAWAAESVTPTPPPWCSAEEYVVFPGSAAYEPENWAVITRVRQEVAEQEMEHDALSDPWPLVNLPDKDAETKELDIGMLFEKSLIEMRLLESGVPDSASLARYIKNGAYKELDGLTDQQRYLVLLWTARSILRKSEVGETLKNYLPYLLKFPQFSLETLVDCSVLTPQQKEGHLAWLRQSLEEPSTNVKVILDNWDLTMDVSPKMKNQRTMVPVRAVGEAIGADVEWVADKQQVVMTRAGSTVIMTLNSTTATIDGEAVEMDVAPYAIGGRTLIPARYVAEFFGQKVTWDGKEKRVLITEDKTVAGDSNLEAWALPMGAILSRMNSEGSGYFGLKMRRSNGVQSARNHLNGWGITNREDLVNTVLSMTYYGHDATFRGMAADAKLRTPEERAEISAASAAWPDYMWEYTQQLDEKWGEKGIMAWDLFRMSNLVQWGYTAGYVTYKEALALLEPAATTLCNNFSSWDEAYENYLDGYNWWARNDVLGQDIWQTQRGKLYRSMKESKTGNGIFDDALFQTGVIPLPKG